jgi:hypothetical protein
MPNNPTCANCGRRMSETAESWTRVGKWEVSVFECSVRHRLLYERPRSAHGAALALSWQLNASEPYPVRCRVRAPMTLPRRCMILELIRPDDWHCMLPTAGMPLLADAGVSRSQPHLHHRNRKRRPEKKWQWGHYRRRWGFDDG